MAIYVACVDNAQNLAGVQELQEKISLLYICHTLQTE